MAMLSLPWSLKINIDSSIHPNQRAQFGILAISFYRRNWPVTVVINDAENFWEDEVRSLLLSLGSWVSYLIPVSVICGSFLAHVVQRELVGLHEIWNINGGEKSALSEKNTVIAWATPSELKRPETVTVERILLTQGLKFAQKFSVTT